MRGTATAPELQLHLASSRAAAPAPRSPSPVSSHAGAAMDRKSKSTKGSASSAAAAAASMAALAAAAAAGDSSSDYSGAAADGALPWHGEEDSVPAKMAAVGDASSSSPVAARRGAAASSSSPSPVAARRGVTAAAAVAAGGGGGGPRCQAERCNANLMTDEKPYNRRHKVCEAHSKAPVVLVAGLRQRFCQQCSRFHELSEFDDIKRSCRLRLAGHNERRRKSSADAHGGGNGFRQHADQNGGRGDPAGGNHFQIR